MTLKCDKCQQKSSLVCYPYDKLSNSWGQPNIELRWEGEKSQLIQSEVNKFGEREIYHICLSFRIEENKEGYYEKVCVWCFMSEIEKEGVNEPAEEYLKKTRESSQFIHIQSLLRTLSKQSEEIFAWSKKITEDTEEAKKVINNIQEKEKEKQEEIERRQRENIYRWDTPYHKIGWPTFLVLGSVIIYRVYKKNEKSKEITNPAEDIRDKFRKWQYNMYWSVAFYIVSFTLIKQAIDKWGYTYITSLVKWNEFVGLVTVSIPLGFLYIGDNIITSSLKTPLQRLAIKIENSSLDEKEKKDLLSKTQEANESFKETFKRFGLTAIPGAIAAIIANFNEKWASNFSYFIPIFYASLIIFDVQKKLDKIEKE
jgi:hypothetical protein